MRVILITGVARPLGARFARSLAADDDLEVIGVDVLPPKYDIGRARYVRADIRSAAIGRLIAGSGVETVVHLGMVSSPTGAGGRSMMKEINVIGTMQLLAACQTSTSVRRLIARSSAAVYGASPRDPARFTEDMAARIEPRSGFGKDAREMESYVDGLARRRPDLVVTTLRFADVIGAHADSALARYLSLRLVPTVMGYDARLQFLHPVDAVTALDLVSHTDLPGTFNVAAPDVITLHQALAVLDRPAIPMPAQIAPSVALLGRHSGWADMTADRIDAVTYGRSMDISRFVAATGFSPAYSTRRALEDFAAGLRPGRLRVPRAGELVRRIAETARPRVERSSGGSHG
ncbi:NAD-dependent epimerase/dehydratase family protein [Microlunatus sp. Gsoil 973]|uniref:NAD-dependent epimerase/dehydratase family protein n=1 Tax=Microlunatus sp. Gsoil 973 TaxID=2672569 RepID=UPI0012B450FA|nr:NAD-dependent epimerase/dehydratase family protein [Microlunatus sp. Gsoil 973]QGN33824.1 NAD-dependent epimerase/dehydratase family protein [Microlunatus sp. Gsoil 973]